MIEAPVSFGNWMSSRTVSVTTAANVFGSMLFFRNRADLHAGDPHVAADIQPVDMIEARLQRIAGPSRAAGMGDRIRQKTQGNQQHDRAGQCLRYAMTTHSAN